ncbi:hypothetical protein CQW23_33326 [Capsicum baccatum]|uniref:Uncharacterized protein n=1 Tax=Capsicum baccatum TaxID=33114 RepID=A0A2G2V262_CAPBA|nr:hypothetical protein CQW23_33326 [Capsicum baccatum]
MITASVQAPLQLSSTSSSTQTPTSQGRRRLQRPARAASPTTTQIRPPPSSSALFGDQCPSRCSTTILLSISHHQLARSSKLHLISGNAETITVTSIPVRLIQVGVKDRFLGDGWLHEESGGQECANGFITLGEIAGALDGELTNYLPTITSHLRDTVLSEFEQKCHERVLLCGVAQG